MSARVAIAALELLVSNLERRALATGDDPVYPRLVDLHMLLPAITGKVEMVYEGEQQGAEVGGAHAHRRGGEEALRGGASRRSGARRASPEDKGPYAPIVAWFAAGNAVTPLRRAAVRRLRGASSPRVPGLLDAGRERGATREERAFAAELVLEGLHQHLKLAREDLDSTVSYKEMLKFQLLRRVARGEGHSDAN